MLQTIIAFEVIRMKTTPWVRALLSMALLLLISRCATIPTCPDKLMPIVEIQVNSTASNHDDYGTTTADMPCRARIANPYQLFGNKNFPGGVAVEIRNPAGSSNLAFSTTAGGTGSATINQTLPDDGSWATFYVTGTSTSAVDKSAIVEMATSASCTEVVLARKAMMIPQGAPPIPPTPARPRVEIEVGTVATIDDYIAWSPVSSRIRWADGTANATLNVTLSNMQGADHLRFTNNTLAAGSTATNATLSLSLPGSGSWVEFYVAGNFASPSTADKDAVLEVTETATGTLLSRDGLMVRIRKNANNLTTPERNRYLDALKKVDATYDSYIKFVKTHSRDSTGPVGSLVAHRQAHQGSAFLPWHRAFVLHMERILQAADPSVALHYWKFDDSAPNIFTQDFMGSNTAGNYAMLAPGNPIVSWSLPGEGVAAGIQRQTPYGDNGHPTVATETATLGLGMPPFVFADFKTMELNPHNPAHSTSGGGVSWIAGSPAIATRDPLFFFLHSNVERLWGRWQWLRNRNNNVDVATYDLQGSYAGAPAMGPNAHSVAANRTLGQYADDSMWPWDNKTGGTPGDPAERPDIAILTPFPVAVDVLLPFAQPQVKTMVDWLGKSLFTTTPSNGLGYGYDDFFPF